MGFFKILWCDVRKAWDHMRQSLHMKYADPLADVDWKDKSGQFKDFCMLKACKNGINESGYMLSLSILQRLFYSLVSIQLNVVKHYVCIGL